MNKSIRRKIVPRKPSDGILVQDCHFYDSVDGEDGGLLVMMPHLSSRSPDAVPFYHPQVAGLAFRYFSVYNEDYEKKSAEEAGLGIVQVNYLPLEIVDFAALPPGRPYWSQDSRTYRTALQLLSLLVKHGKAESAGASYVKRVHHDKIVPREVFQDLYVRLKEKYLWILQEWKESTDPLKHVFEVGQTTHAMPLSIKLIDYCCL